VRANITVDEGLLRRIDAAAAAEDNTRSGYLTQAAQQRINQHLGSWATKRQRDLKRQFQLLRSGKMRTHENRGVGEVDTTAESIRRAETWLAELAPVIQELSNH
jgi:predicted transcriptional regulator